MELFNGRIGNRAVLIKLIATFRVLGKVVKHILWELVIQALSEKQTSEQTIVFPLRSAQICSQ